MLTNWNISIGALKPPSPLWKPKGGRGGGVVTNVIRTVRHHIHTNLSSLKLKIRYPANWKITKSYFHTGREIRLKRCSLCEGVCRDFLKGILVRKIWKTISSTIWKKSSSNSIGIFATLNAFRLGCAQIRPISGRISARVPCKKVELFVLLSGINWPDAALLSSLILPNISLRPP